MLKPDPNPDDEPEPDVPEDESPSFADLMMLVFSGPMCFECLDESEGEDTMVDEVPVGEE